MRVITVPVAAAGALSLRPRGPQPNHRLPALGVIPMEVVDKRLHRGDATKGSMGPSVARRVSLTRSISRSLLRSLSPA